MRAGIAALLAVTTVVTTMAAAPAFAADPAERYSSSYERRYERSRVVVEEPIEEEVVIRRRFVRELEPVEPHLSQRYGPRARIIFDDPYGWAEDDEEAW